MRSWLFSAGRWITNRVILGLLVFFGSIAIWEFRLKPQYRPIYETAIASYQRGDHAAALEQMRGAYEIAPNSTDVIMMMGWINLKLRNYDEARYYFDRVLKIDPRIEEARMGDSFVALETGRGNLDYDSLQEILGHRSDDPNVRILLAGSLLKAGRVWEAASHYQTIARDRNYGRAAQAALDDLFGLSGFDDPVPSSLHPLNRPAELQVRHRAAEGAMWRVGSSRWDRFYVTGVNLGPGAPGHSPASPSNDGQRYSRWLENIETLNANVVRVYTLLPPAFYRALLHRIDAGRDHTLYQQIWIGDPPDRDLYGPGFADRTRTEIRQVVDAIHGRAVVVDESGRSSAIYTSDVAAHVGAILLGRELEPSVVRVTNARHPARVRYDGTYVSVENATPTEVWFSEMLDYLVKYETDTYNWQHPVAIVNWPPLDPLHHPTEAPTDLEAKFRALGGERVGKPTGFEDDDDVVSIDEAKYRAGPAFAAGLFASYHVYPYYPDFLVLDPQYAATPNGQNGAPLESYLRELRLRLPHPVVVTEFGIPSSMGVAHVHPQGWNHGGHTEERQAEILIQMARAVREAGCAGGIVFALQDEWYRTSWLTRDFEAPLERAGLWLNQYDPAQFFGLIGYHTGKSHLFAGDPQAWEGERTLYTDVAPARGDVPGLRRVQAAVDEAFLYLRLSLDCPACRITGGRFPLEGAGLAIALNTMPGRAGIQRMPFREAVVTSGANFLLYLSRPDSSRLLVSNNYNPYALVPTEGVPGQTSLVYKRSLAVNVQEQGSFEELVVETNRRRYGRDGTLYPEQRHNRSLLHYGNGHPAASDYDSLAEWYLDIKNSAILVRLSWGKLLVSDPSSHQVFAGIDDRLAVQTSRSDAIEITAFLLRSGEPPDVLAASQVVASAPARTGERTAPGQQFAWNGWNSVDPPPYFKKAFHAVQQEFATEKAIRAQTSRVQPAFVARRGRAGGGAR